MPISQNGSSVKKTGPGKVVSVIWLAPFLLPVHTLWGQSPSLSPSSLQVLGGGGLASATVTIAAGTAWSASSNVGWITFPSGNSGTGNAGLVYQVAQNPSSSSGRTGTITVTSAGGSATLNVGESAFASGGPTATLANSLTNGNLPSQATQTLTFNFGSPNGPGYLYYIGITITDGSPYGCYIYYYPGYNSINYAEHGSGIGFNLGQQVNGTHCDVNATSTVTSDPSNAAASITMNLSLTLNPSARGPQNIYIEAQDNNGVSNTNTYPQVATWTAFGLVTSNPPSVSLATTPVAGSSQLLHYQISDGNGYTYISQLAAGFGSNTSFNNSPCYFYFFPPDTVYLYQIANGVWTSVGRGTVGGSWTYPPSNGILGGSGGLPGPGICTIDLNQSKVSAGSDGTGILQDPNSGTPWQPVTNLYLDLWTGLDPGAQATLPLNIYMSAYDATGAGPNNSNVGVWPGQNPPVLSVTSAHSGNFVQGQNGSYTLTVTNASGAGATAGTVTVIETLPAALTLLSMSGTGWSCASNHCTRSDSLNGGASYPAINVTVSVASNATSPQTNQVGVSGGGSSAVNATDATVILAVPTVSPQALTVLGGGGMESASITIVAGATWSASSNVGWITFPLGNGGTGSGTLTYQVAVNPSNTTGRSGTITVTSSGGSATLSVSESGLASGGPTAGITNQLTNGALPNSATQTLSFAFGSPNGPGYLNYLSINISNTGGGPYPCQMYYYPQSNQFYFYNSTGGWSGYALGTAGQQANGTHCSLDVGNSSATANPASPTASWIVNLRFTLPSSAVGTQNVYIFAYDNNYSYNGNLGSVATWTVNSLLTTNPPAVSLAVQPGNGASQTIHYEISDGNGYTYLEQIDGALSHNSSWSDTPCLVLFQLPNWLTLYQIAGGTYSFLGEGYVGGSWSYPSGNGVIGGSGGMAGPGTCSIDLNRSTVSSSSDGTGVLENPNTGNPAQQITTIYLDLVTSLDNTAQSTLPLNVYLSSWDVASAGTGAVSVGTWNQPLPPPNITYLSPAWAITTSGQLTISIYGTHFSPGAVVTFNGAALATSYISPTQLTATIPANTLFAGDYSANVTLSGSTSNTATFSVFPPLTISGPGSIPTGTATSPYPGTTITATGGNGSYVWSAVGLPPGMSVGNYNGVISGIPASNTGSPFTAQVTVTDGNFVTATVTYHLVVNPPLVISSPASLPVGTANSAYPGVPATATGGSGAYTWSASGLPSGLSINAATGIIGGTPAGATTGSITVQVTVTDSNGIAAGRSYTLAVNPTLSVTGPSSLPAGTVNVAYPGATMTAAGGSGTYTWSATGLPQGMSIANTTGVLSGTPTESNGSPFSVQVTTADYNMATASSTYSLRIASGWNFGLVTDYDYIPTPANSPVTISVPTTCANGFTGTVSFVDVLGAGGFNYTPLSYATLPAGYPFYSGGVPCGSPLWVTFPIYAGAQSGPYAVGVTAQAYIDGQWVQHQTILPIEITTTQAAGLAPSPYSQSVTPGGAPAVFGLGLIVPNGFAGSATLSCSSGALCPYTSFSNSTLSGSQLTATMNVTAPAGTAPGVYPLTVSAATSSNTVSAFIQVTVSGPSDAGFTLSASPNWQQLVAGGSALYTITAVPVNGFGGDINLSCAGLPAGVSATFGTNPITASGSYTGTLTLTAGSAVPVGATATCTVVGSSGSVASVTAAGAQIVSGGPAQNGTTVTTSPAGLSLTVDGSACIAPCVFQWPAGGQHTITTSPTQGSDGTQYVFSGWSDGQAQTHTITASGSATYTANFLTQYYLLTTPSPSIAGSISPASGWYNSGQVVQVNATAAAGYAFTGFTGALNGMATQQSLAMVGPEAVAANFTVVPSSIPVSALPLSQTVAPGDSAAFTVTVSSIAGLTGTVTLTASGLPQGANASFNPPTLNGAGTANMIVSTTATSPGGTYTITLTASDGFHTQTNLALITVTTPSAANMLSPATGSNLAPGATTFAWDSGMGVSQYQLLLGSAPGSSDLYQGVAGSNRIATVTLPSANQTVYASLKSQIGGVWQAAQQYVYSLNSSAVTSIAGSTLQTTSGTYGVDNDAQAAKYPFCISSSPSGCVNNNYNAANTSSCEVLQPDGTVGGKAVDIQDPFVTARIVATGTQSSGHQSNDLDILFVAGPGAPVGPRDLVCTYAGQKLPLQHALTVYDGPPQIFRPPTLYPPSYPGGPFYAAIYGTRFGPRPGRVTVGLPVSGGACCASTSDLQVTQANGDGSAPAGAQYAYWSDSQANVLLTPTSSASGNYDLLVTASYGQAGSPFSANPADYPSPRSNPGPIEVTPAPPVTISVTVTNSINDAAGNPTKSKSADGSSYPLPPKGPLKWPSGNNLPDPAWPVQNPVILLRDLPCVVVTTGMGAPDTGTQLTFQILRNTTANGSSNPDAAALGTGIPTTRANQNCDGSAAQNTLALTPDQTGSFQVLAFVDANSNGSWDAGEEGAALPLIIVQVIFDRNQSYPNATVQNRYLGCSQAANGTWRIRSGIRPTVQDDSAVAIRLSADVDLVGGGSYGSLGLGSPTSPTIGGGWVQRLAAFTEPAGGTPSSVAASYQNNHYVSEILASDATCTLNNNSQVPCGDAQSNASVLWGGTAQSGFPVPGVFLPGNSAGPIFVPPPMLDTAKTSPGTGADSSTLFSSNPVPLFNSATHNLGVSITIQANDTPATSFPATHPAYPSSAIQSMQMNYMFSTSLVLWSNTFNQLYGLILDQPWSISISCNTSDGTPTGGNVLNPAAGKNSLIFVPGTPTGGTPTILVKPTVLGSFTFDGRQ